MKNKIFSCVLALTLIITCLPALSVNAAEIPTQTTTDSSQTTDPNQTTTDPSQTTTDPSQTTDGTGYAGNDREEDEDDDENTNTDYSDYDEPDDTDNDDDDDNYISWNINYRAMRDPSGNDGSSFEKPVYLQKGKSKSIKLINLKANTEGIKYKAVGTGFQVNDSGVIKATGEGSATIYVKYRGTEKVLYVRCVLGRNVKIRSNTKTIKYDTSSGGKTVGTIKAFYKSSDPGHCAIKSQLVLSVSGNFKTTSLSGYDTSLFKVKYIPKRKQFIISFKKSANLPSSSASYNFTWKVDGSSGVTLKVIVKPVKLY